LDHGVRRLRRVYRLVGQVKLVGGKLGARCFEERGALG
jgi:hypothetical protein